MARNLATIPRWQGVDVTAHNGHPEELRALLPTIERVPFMIDGVENPRYDLTVESGTQFPIATVSKNYELVQHTVVFDRAMEAMRHMGLYDADGLRTELRISEHGEWMKLICTLPPGFDFTPGDGYPMSFQLAISNSVDGSAAVNAGLEWLRMICGNALTAGMGGGFFRKPHNKGVIDSDLLEQYLNQAIAATPADTGKIKEWEQLPVMLDARLSDWTTGEVEKLWGQKTAARVHSILTTGWDGSVANPPKGDDEIPGMTALDRVVRKEVVVPGQPARAETAFDVANALSWVSKSTRSERGRNYRLMQLPQLVENLALGTPVELKGHYMRSEGGVEFED